MTLATAVAWDREIMELLHDINRFHNNPPARGPYYLERARRALVAFLAIHTLRKN